MPAALRADRQLILSQYKGGKSIEDLMAEHGVKMDWLYELFRKNGVKTRGHDKSLNGADDDIRAMIAADTPCSFIAARYGCSQTTIYRKLLQLGIARPQPVLVEDDVAAAFMGGATLKDVMQRFHIGHDRGREIAASVGVTISGRKYDLDESFFRVIDTETKAYVLGFLQADGCNDGRYSWQVNVVDRELIEVVKEAVGYSGPIRTRTRPTGQLQFGINVCSRLMLDDLSRYGCVPNKSHHGWFPSSELVPDTLMRHYVRGLFDGDGCIALPKSRKILTVSLTGNRAICSGCAEAAERLAGVKSRVRLSKVGPTGHETYAMNVTSRPNMLRFLGWIYDGTDSGLKRKRARYQLLREQCGL